MRNHLETLTVYLRTRDCSTCKTSIYIFEDNEAVLKQMNKSRSPTMRDVSRTHRVDLDRLYDRIHSDPMIQIKYVNAKQQLADILTKGSFTEDRLTQLTLLVNSMTHTTLTQKQLVSFFCVCECFIFQHESTCWRIFRYIGQRDTKASSLGSKDCGEN